MSTFDVSAAYRAAASACACGPDDAGEPSRPADADDRRTASRPPRPRDRFGRPRARGQPNAMAHAEEPEEVVATLHEAFERAVALFDAERFFEAHEFFEHIWKSAWIEPGDADFWKGVTQVAVGCCHVQRGNDAGAQALLRRAAGYLADFPARYHGVDAARLAAAAEDLAARARQHGASPQLAFPRFPQATA